MSSPNYTNSAFISYKREDEQWAKWLQSKLEGYKLPVSVRRQRPDLPEWAGPVFRDATDLSGGVLSDALKEGLASSKFLIVVCSPGAAKSPWVCKEVREFIESGREEYIIPFIVEGVPHSDDPGTECFPNELLELSGKRELLGINVNENGRDSAAVKVIARMFDLRFDSLWDRHMREERKRKRMVVTGLSLVIVILTGVVISTAVSYLKVKESNWKMMEQQARAVAYQAGELVGKGDYAKAAGLCLRVLPENVEKPGRPLTIEALNVLYSCLDSDLGSAGFVVRTDRDEYYGSLFPYMDAMYCLDGKGILFLGKKKASVLDAGSREKKFDFDDSGVASVSPDGKLAAVFPDSTAIVHNLETGAAIKEFSGHKGRVRYAGFSHDGRHIVTASDDHTAMIWDLFTGRTVQSLIGHGMAVNCASYSCDDKRIITSSYDGTVRIWDSSTGEQLRVIREEKGEDRELYASYSPDGNYVLTVTNPYMFLPDNKFDECYKRKDGHEYCFIGFNWGLMAFDENAGGVQIRSAETGEPVWKFSIPGTGVIRACFSPDSKSFLSVMWDGSVYVCDIDSGSTEKIISGNVNSACFNPDDSDCLLVSYDDGTIREIHVSKLQRRAIKQDVTVPGQTIIAYSPDGKAVLTVSSSQWDDPVVRMYDPGTGKRLGEFSAHTKQITGAAFSDDGKSAVTASADGTAIIWDVQTGAQKQTLNHGGFVFAAGFDHGNGTVATTGPDNIKLWNVLTGKMVKQLDVDDSVSSGGGPVSFSPSGRYLAAGSYRDAILIWDLETGEQVQSIKRRDYDSCDKTVAFDPEENYVVCGPYNISVWEIATGGMLFSTGKDDALRFPVRFSDDGHAILSGKDEVCHFYTPQELIEKFSDILEGYDLTVEEERQYYLR